MSDLAPYIVLSREEEADPMMGQLLYLIKGVEIGGSQDEFP
ncbi:hypothetical protein [Peribacillus muralis]